MPAWLFGSLRAYRGEWLRGDLVAGLTVWAVLVPESARLLLGRLRGDLVRTGVALLVSRDVGQVRDVLRRTGAADEVGERRVYPSVSAAVAAAADPVRAGRG